ncbi:MAG TPA: ABC transporter ATP-binding protein [Archaeoglobus profundus]|nr:ABC transporter ATP-binding protein [Archaeoglobus profundus]HIP57697.1 ABC transporter ATP-binding protein [Archaeoglobus profundus]
MKVVKLKNVTKRFGRHKVLDNVSLDVKRGESLALIGPNGAGKTTVVKIIGGMLKPSSGEVYVFGKKPWQDYIIKRRIGIVTHDILLYEDLTAYENLMFYCKLYDVIDEGKINELLKIFGLYDRRHDLVKNFSRGMKQRLSIVRAFLHDPELLILDEPMAGLDREGKRIVKEYIIDIDSTVIITAHDIREVKDICERIVIMHNGKIVGNYEKRSKN